MDDLLPETKSIVDGIISGVLQVFDTEQWRSMIRTFVKKKYRDELEKQELQFNMNFIGDEQTLQNLADYAFGSIAEVQDSVGRKLRGSLQRGIIEGNDVTQLKKRIKQTFKDTNYNARLKMVIRTEGMRAGNIAAFQAAQESGRPLKKYLRIVLDQWTSNICKAENKKYGEPSKAISLDRDFIVTVDNKEFRGLYPPFHPNCRTNVAFVEQGKNAQKLYGSAEDVERFIKEEL